jgi:ribosome modulation factor
MAGKIHTDWMSHDAGVHPQMVQGRLAKAYAEGYQASVNGGSEGDNPHPVDDSVLSIYHCWWRGFRDAAAGFPATHVGGPDGVPAKKVEKAKHR